MFPCQRRTPLGRAGNGREPPRRDDGARGHRAARPRAHHEHRNRAHRPARFARRDRPREEGDLLALHGEPDRLPARGRALFRPARRGRAGTHRGLRAAEYPGVRGQREPGTGWYAHPLGGIPGPLPPGGGPQPRKRPRCGGRGARARRSGLRGARGPGSRTAAVRPIRDPARQSHGAFRRLQCQPRLDGARPCLGVRTRVEGPARSGPRRHAGAGRGKRRGAPCARTFPCARPLRPRVPARRGDAAGVRGTGRHSGGRAHGLGSGRRSARPAARDRGARGRPRAREGIPRPRARARPPQPGGAAAKEHSSWS